MQVRAREPEPLLPILRRDHQMGIVVPQQPRLLMRAHALNAGTVVEITC